MLCYLFFSVLRLNTEFFFNFFDCSLVASNSNDLVDHKIHLSD